MRRFAYFTLVQSFVCLASQAVPASAQTDAANPEYFEKNIRPLLKQYCLDCHSTEKQKGELDLERFTLLTEVKRHPKVWQAAIEQLTTNEMPPKDKPQPKSDERERLASWVRGILDDLARARAGDPGPVVLRRLSNAEYTYTVRDLTGVEVDPAREFPVDGAAGEGFMNTGNSLVMSPSLFTKYLDAAKEIASHAVLLPDGFGFSPKTTRRDWTEETLAQIREFYREFTDPQGGTRVNLQGIVYDTNTGGRLPVEKYLAATLTDREALTKGSKTFEEAARERGLSAKYLRALWRMLHSDEPSLLLDNLRRRWGEAKPSDAAALAAEIGGWQNALWKFSSVGHIGKVGGPKAWQEPVNPITTKQEVRFKIPAAADGMDVTLYLIASDAADGREHDFAVWQRPRLVAPGRPDLLLRDVRQMARVFAERRERVFSSAGKCLMAAAEVKGDTTAAEIGELARKHGAESDVLSAWLDFLGLGTGGVLRIEGYLTNTIASSAGYDFVKGWGSHSLPLLVANSTDAQVRIPGVMKPHGVAVHPTPKLAVAVGWRSPAAASVQINATIKHAHPECGNGVTWSVELRRGATRQRFGAGVAQGSREGKAGPFENVSVQAGDLVSLIIGPRDNNHSCDLTAIDLTITSAGESGRKWDLAGDVSGDILAGNPHADKSGNDGIWHFYSEPVTGNETGPVIPAGSLLARWQKTGSAEEKKQIADELQKLLASGLPVAKESPDAALYRQLASLGGPLFSGLTGNHRLGETHTSASKPSSDSGLSAQAAGLDPALFGKHPRAIDPDSLCVQAPSVIEVRLPSELVEGCEFVTTGLLDPETGAEGSVQLQVSTNKPESITALLASAATVQKGGGYWTSNNSQVAHSTPIIVNEGSTALKRIEASFDDFRRWFPSALCYTKIVPVDEVVTLTLYYREDDQLSRLMLDDAQKAKLDRLWNELRYTSHDALTLVDALEQIIEYATQDADPKVFEPLRKPFGERASAFRQWLVESEPQHLKNMLDFAGRAYRRPLTQSETEELRGLYHKLREQEIPHDEALRLTLARVLVAPTFLYRLEKPGPGSAQTAVSDWELASRLSYFLWSSQPDAELRELAAAGRLRQPGVLVAQARRMLKDARVRRLATEFGCQWLHIHSFDTLDEKSERHFPTFAGLRGAMYEESILFFTDLFQNDRSVLSLLDSDHTFLNEALAKHYGIPEVTGADWRRVDGVRKFSRGGILAQATTLAKQSGASRTSPILRGNWVAEALLGEKLPRPPKEVPRLPEDETATEGLTVRQLVEKHSSDPSCANCHVRIDPYGFALESFDAIGRWREKDLADRPIDTRSKVMDGTALNGLDGLRNYLLTKRREAIVRQFSKKLLGYALGRGVQLSDEPLLAEMQTKLKAQDYRFATAVETIVLSRQFREIRGKEAAYED